jgi:hypothetical protein
MSISVYFDSRLDSCLAPGRSMNAASYETCLGTTLPDSVDMKLIFWTIGLVEHKHHRGISRV